MRQFHASRENVREQVTIGFGLMMFLIGWESGTSFVNQPQDKVTQIKPKEIWITFNTQSIDNHLISCKILHYLLIKGTDGLIVKTILIYSKLRKLNKLLATYW